MVDNHTTKIMEQLSEVRYIKKRKFEERQHENDLFQKLQDYLEFDPIKRRNYILTRFFMKIINKNRRATLISEDPSKRLSDIQGLRIIHVGDIVLDLYEFEYIKKNIKRGYWKHCSSEYKKASNIMYQQNMEFQKSLWMDQCRDAVKQI